MLTQSFVRVLLPVLMLLCGITVTSAQHEAPPVANAFDRPIISLNGDWQHFPDRYEAYFYDFVRVPFDSSKQGRTDFAAMDAVAANRTDRYEYAFDGTPPLAVPGDWNTQYERYLLYEGSVWYRKRFPTPASLGEGERLMLHFGAANYRADVYVNGQKAGMHEGGFTPFQFDVTDLIRGGDSTNSLVVRVDNQRRRDAVPTDVTDWWNYGGLTRDVKLMVVADTYISEYAVRFSDATYAAQTNTDTIQQAATGTVSGFVQVTGPLLANRPVRVRCNELGFDATVVTDAFGKASFSVSGIEVARLWHPGDPYRYTFEFSTAGPAVTGTVQDKITECIGLRTITTEGPKLLLNGRNIFLRGISAHEQAPLRGGRANGWDDAATMIGWARELGCNFMRLAHYPHNEYMPRLADSLGVLLWEEVPVYWTIDWANPATYASAEQQLSELVVRDRNRAAVIIWSMANETPDTPERLTFLKKLADHTRELDPTRLISAALFKQNVGPHQYEVTDPFAEYADVVSFNEYIGWYEGTPEVLDGARFTFRPFDTAQGRQNKPVIISEFGGGAKAGFRGDSLTRWSEDYQDYLYRETLELIDRTPQVAGITPWILADFKSPRRNLPGIQDGWNRKGLIGEHGARKLAFRRLQAWYRGRAK